MNPLRYLQIGAVLLLIGAGVAGVLSYKHLAAKAATAEARITAAEATAAALQRQYDTLSREVIRRSQLDAAIRDARRGIQQRLDEAAHEDPVARDYLDERIPDGVRDAFASPSER